VEEDLKKYTVTAQILLPLMEDFLAPGIMLIQKFATCLLVQWVKILDCHLNLLNINSHDFVLEVILIPNNPIP
jgi:hypothetical protein